MAAELQPLDALTSIIAPPIAGTSTTLPPYNPPSLDNLTTVVTNPPKRQRRPSVRLGEIGGEPLYDSHTRRPNTSWRSQKHPSIAAKTPKIRPLTNLVNGGGGESNFQDLAEPSDNYGDFSQPKAKIRKPAKRARTNWSKFEYPALNNGSDGGGGGLIEDAIAFQEENENNNDEFREFELEGSESPLLKDQQSPVNSAENMGLQFWNQQRRGNRTRVSESNGGLHNEVNSPEEKRSEGNLGVKEWLSGLGLGRYAPVFEIHEVDDEVLPILTLEDLRDMGINAVGSRRKMYSSILKLRKGFS